MQLLKDITITQEGIPVLQQDLYLLSEKHLHLPQSFQLSIQRFKKRPLWNWEETCKINYTPASQDDNAVINLMFCVQGNTYCHSKDKECDACKWAATPDCKERIESIDLIQCRFETSYLKKIIKPKKDCTSISDALISGKHPHLFSRSITICSKSRMIIESLLQHPYNDTLEQIYLGAQMQLLLLSTLECVVGDQEEVPVFTCKFLSNSADREKIVKARDILLEHIGNPITIKTLSRKVAMNECYLKKGFKEIFGCTIFEFYQNQRMEHAKQLLYDKGLSVTEVSMQLGYSSISHFSTAFKKHTGLKPCELLLRN